ncbi:hypothetical protein Bbelb_439870 [Branchiostoma belcheri]|nr:hypothetical protein Bbelb_439870 [Branchiostoma belcheri]
MPSSWANGTASIDQPGGCGGALTRSQRNCTQGQTDTKNDAYRFTKPATAAHWYSARSSEGRRSQGCFCREGDLVPNDEQRFRCRVLLDRGGKSLKRFRHYTTRQLGVQNTFRLPVQPQTLESIFSNLADTSDKGELADGVVHRRLQPSN